MTKMHVPFLTLLFKFLVLLLKIGVIYVIILSKKVKNTFPLQKYKENFPPINKF